MRELKYLQELLFLLVMGFSLFALQACGSDDKEGGEEPFDDPSENTGNIAVTGEVVSYGITYAEIAGYANLSLLPVGTGNPEIGVEIIPSSDNAGAVRQETAESLTGNEFTVGFRSLSPCTEYKYRSFVRYGGLTHYGEFHTFVTKDVISVTTTGEASDITYSSAKITSSIHFDRVDPRDTLMVGVAYSTSASALHPDSVNLESRKQSMYDVEGGVYSVTLDWLFENTVYYYVSYTELNGKYRFAEVKSFTTTELGIAKSGAVDLGLSIKWAACNVGASSPEEYGGYYAWGEVEEKSDYSWSTYKWCNGTSNSMTKYCIDTHRGTVDNKTILDPEDDVAHVKLGGGWRMPTSDEMKELYDICTWERIHYNGVYGELVTGPNGNSIFLPAAGQRINTSFVPPHLFHYSYWSATLHNINNFAYNLSSTKHGGPQWSKSSRYYGHSVRPVSD